MLLLTAIYHATNCDTYTTESESCEEARQFVEDATGCRAEVIGMTTRIPAGAVRHGDLSSPFFAEDPNVGSV